MDEPTRRIKHHSDIEPRPTTDHDQKHMIPHEHFKDHQPFHPHCAICKARKRKAERSKPKHD